MRPEKIRLMDAAVQPNGDDHEVRSALGTVREVVYAGSATRFLVDLDAGGSLMVLQQNLRTSSMDVLAYRESRVCLLWQRAHEFRVTEAGRGGRRLTARGGGARHDQHDPARPARDRHDGWTSTSRTGVRRWRRRVG